MSEETSNRKTLKLVIATLAGAVVVLLFLTQLGPGADDVDEGADGTKIAQVEGGGVVAPPMPFDEDEIIRSPSEALGGGTVDSFSYDSPDKRGFTKQRILGETVEILANGRRRIPKPRAWVYLYGSDGEDGDAEQLLYVTADEAIVSGVELDIDAGELRGNVLMQIPSYFMS